MSTVVAIRMGTVVVLSDCRRARAIRRSVAAMGTDPVRRMVPWSHRNAVRASAGEPKERVMFRQWSSPERWTLLPVRPHPAPIGPHMRLPGSAGSSLIQNWVHSTANSVRLR